ncbi:MAG: recombinase family protein [Actinomycetota bacterium]|nr:recombinase family protein [Actinomycetota bacterium]
MGAVIYTRSARPNRATHAHQRAACHRLAAELGYEVSGEFHDNGQIRPALDQALATIRDGQAAALVVADLYRLSRSSTEFARIIEALDDADVPLYVVRQGRVSLPATHELGIMLAIAEYEAEHSEEDFTL